MENNRYKISENSFIYVYHTCIILSLNLPLKLYKLVQLQRALQQMPKWKESNSALFLVTSWLNDLSNSNLQQFR